MNSLYIVLFFISMSSSIITPLIGPLIFAEGGFFSGRSIEYQMQAYALIMGGYALGMIIGNLFWGILSDTVGGKKAILWALTGSTLSYFLCSISLFFMTFSLIFIGRCLEGLMAGRRTVALSMILQTSTKDQVTSFRYSEIVNALGLLLGPLFSGMLVNFSEKVPLYYYSGPLLIMGIVMLGNIVLVHKNTEEKPIIHSVVKVKKAFFHSRLVFSYFTFFILELGWYLYFLTIAPYIIVYWKFTPLAVGVFSSILILIYIAMLLWVFPFLKLFLGEKWLSYITLGLGGLCMILMGIDTNHYILFLIYNMGIVLAISCNTPLFMAQITRLKKEEERGKNLGFQNSIIGLAWIFSSINIGLFDITASTIFIISGLLFAVIPFIQWLGKNTS